MAALRRGIARYADGTDNVPTPVRTIPVSQQASGPMLPTPGLTPAAPITSAPGYTDPALTSTPAAAATPPTAYVDPALTPAPPPASAFSQVLHGQYHEALANPEASPATRFWAQHELNADMAARAVNLTKGAPTPFERLYDWFGGNQATGQALDQRQAIADAFQNQQVQQHLSTHEGDLRAAEADPLGFSQLVQTPGFKQYMNDAQTHLNNLTTFGAYHPADENGPAIVIPPHQLKDPQSAAKIMAHVPGATYPQAVAGVQPQDFSADQFARIFASMPKRDFFTIFGPQISHYVTPEEAVQRKYFGILDAEYNGLAAQRQQLLAANPKADTSAIDAQIATSKDKIMNAMKIMGGLVQKPFAPMQ